MADDTHNTSDLSDPVTAGSPKEDAETKATREELKQTAISDDKTKTASAGEDDDAALARTKTPELDPPGANRDSLKEQVSSPKKKRGHDEVDEQRDVEGADPASSATISERDKKRQRDGQATEEDKTADEAGTTVAADKATDTTAQAAGAASPKKADTASTTTSSSAFASSGLSKLTGTTSPFGALGGSAKPSVFGGASSTAGSASPFGSLGGAAPAAKPAAPSLSFGNKPGASSPFATLNGPSTSTFGSAFPSGFGSALPGGAKLSSFAKPGDVFKSDKPAKPFGAPESDAEEGDDDDEGSDVNEQSGAEEVEPEEKEKEEPKAVVDDKKKPKLQKVSVDDGEAGEATIFSARTRLYHLEKETGWKERGAGIIKVNVPEASVEFDEAGVAIPTSFDASVLDEEDDDESGGERKSKVVRLIMRQDSTHRVILNTVVVPATDFQKRTALKYTTVLFPAFEGEDAKPVSMQMKLSEANAENFIQLMVGIQKELRGE